jgi:hypothetical protein
MNEKLLLQKKINFPMQYINFLKFIHPYFSIISSFEEYDYGSSNGIIYIGKLTSTTVDELNSITNKWIIVNEKEFDYDLTTNDGLIKNLLPIYYSKLKQSKESFSTIYSISYEALIEKIKICLINNTELTFDDVLDQSVFNLFVAILGTRDVLNFEFFNLVNDKNILLITSSVLTFLNKVQTQNINGASIHYSRLIIQSYKRYGKRIKQAVYKFVKSKANRQIALYHLLIDLNRA